MGEEKEKSLIWLFVRRGDSGRVLAFTLVIRKERRKKSSLPKAGSAGERIVKRFVHPQESAQGIPTARSNIAILNGEYDRGVRGASFQRRPIYMPGPPGTLGWTSLGYKCSNRINGRAQPIRSAELAQPKVAEDSPVDVDKGLYNTKKVIRAFGTNTSRAICR
jgi:hypothetical protein